MSVIPHSDLGATNDAEARAAALDAYGQAPDVSRRPVEILRERVLTIAKARLADPERAAAERCERGFAIFLMSTEFRKDRARPNAVRVPNVDTGFERLAGRAWIVPPTLTSAVWISIAASDLGGAFCELEESALGDYAAIVVDFTSLELRIYENGVTDDENVVRVTIAREDLDYVSLSSLLLLFTAHSLVTPNCQTSSLRIWTDGAQYIPAQTTEKKVQELLFLFLRARLADTYVIESEYSLRSGRIDLVINKKLAPGTWLKYAVLELKVARSVSCRNRPTPPAALVRHIAKGYQQVRVYKQELESRQGWLVVYDMRRLESRDGDLFAPHRLASATDCIELHLDPLFGTADDYRSHCA